MSRLADLLDRAGRILTMPVAEPVARRFPCARCGADIGRSCWICDGCAKGEAGRHRAELLARARESIPAKFRGVRFASPEFSKRVKASDLAIASAKAAPTGKRAVVTIIGAAGAGKTTLACAMLSDVIEAAADLKCDANVLGRARFARFADAVDLSQARQEHRLGADAPPTVLMAKNASVLVVDEFGRDDRRVADVAKVIHDREAASRLTIVTTWMDQRAIADAYDGGVARRLFEKATVIRLGAQ